MSAFIVTDKTVTAICEGFRRFDIGISNPNGREYDRADYWDEADEVSHGYFKWLNAMHEEDIRSTLTGEGFSACGQALVNMNYRSVNARYEENEAPHTFKPTYNINETEVGNFRREYNEAEILGAIRCYEYQSCECEEYYKSGIPDALKRLTMSIAYALAEDIYGDNEGMGYGDIS